MPGFAAFEIIENHIIIATDFFGPLGFMSHGSQEILRSYRNLYRQGLYAVQYSSPARHTLKRCLQVAFRTGMATDFNARKIENTIQFMKSAGRDNGLEHHILKNLLRVRWWQAQTKLYRK